MKEKKKKLISLIVPCLNEEEALPIFYEETKKVLKTMDVDYEILIIDDGSRDNTFQVAKKLAEEDKGVKYISDLEKQSYSGAAYYASVEDTTVNYLYAMYMLSRCESFISNCMCSGAKLVTSFNDGKFVRNEIVSEMLAENQ